MYQLPIWKNSLTAVEGMGKQDEKEGEGQRCVAITRPTRVTVLKPSAEV